MLEPIVDPWASIIEQTSKSVKRYSQVWHGQTTASTDYFNFNRVRERYNNENDPVDWLYLVCRCVKNAVRFNVGGPFTQSHDKRRLGMAPDKMALAVEGV
ncbi:DNA adenine methylase [Xylella fastidiosa subsp. fastidiosa]|jgi:DNA adenine methylase|uniref:site-specific DNA-methyltransferase (adenine-specific) n=2 Tax=Xylella fastidiosa TaxID=2371 RepID=B2I5B1_XYLF2|nr:DNA adenine methylase [Xylella fastidiosa]ADN64074.1 hypothetical protein XFLM_11075 [Xylella fastidiosa subsp. fastidiosa GB514]KAF0570362.1 DNA methyltransferase [Xylella fastidiosa subsp. fastidiosa Mus-1]ACB92554.1 hypothetical protein XfasM23_1126 [Xylella fastidiosa M23]EGO81900.1 Site-specific DNA methylase Dam [Xylella fastidiosa EB92.1]KGM20584.1 DNA methyltransferase [Xylella fastidiosa]